ncbi:MAG: HD-GYP domain-containing protein [Candidatus Eisenbacteria bacterium]|uniref:HD-GYP domain-containing protein n=1 Tax=Eiseniibacteriota bacterium TaxID=2212470 RepID=A0A538T4W8_UNCEI|nr:MAG: HD-GYP domain-containing protein [Candidatus Eisenbacteria bacterium]
MQTKTQATQPLLSGTPADLPGPLPALQMLNQVARSLGYVEGPRSPFLAVIEGVRTLLHADGVAVLVRDPSGEYRFHAAQGGLEEWRDYTLSAPGSQLLETLHSRDRITLFKRKQRSPWSREFLLAAKMNWGALAPIRVRDEKVGALLVNNREAVNVRAEHIEAFENLATLAGVAVQEVRVREGLEDLFMSVIVSLTMALEAKDPYTEGHSVRVAAYSEAIGKQLGLPPATLDMIHRSCLLHDIGKIAVDETILAKKGRLNQMEREKMDMHVLIGENILRPIALLHPLLPGVRHHHERFDGTGHPDGLRGEAIPIEARIMAVADAFDAMTSNRPYREPLPEEEALTELRRAAGAQFDPRVVAAFEQIYPAVKRTLEHLRPRRG